MMLDSIGYTDSQRSTALLLFQRIVVCSAVIALIVSFENSALAVGSRAGCPEPMDFSSPPSVIPKPETIVRRSPNFENRGNTPTTVDSIVIHTTQLSLSGTLRLFGGSAGVSSHFVIAPNGDIYQMVDTADRAWHATYYNSRSIGIEMVGDYMEPSTWNEDNLAALVKVLAWSVSAYPNIPLTHPEGDAYDFPGDRLNVTGLVAHGQVQPWNRGDPGPFFPWDDVLDDVAARLASVPEPSSVLLLVLGSFGLLSRRRRG